MAKCDNCPNPIPRESNCQIQEFAQFELKELQADLIEAIKVFYQNDKELLERKVNEVCITSHIFHYFASAFSKKYCDYNIDPEYNRNGEETKRYNINDNRYNYARPDLILHKRGCNRHNLLYIEFKTNKKSYSQQDKEKIIRFVSNEGIEESGRRIKPYRYKYGVSVLLNINEVSMLWYCNGQNISLCECKFSTKTWEKI